MFTALDQVAYADRLTQRLAGDGARDLHISTVGQLAIRHIRLGCPIRDYWAIEDPIWADIRPIRDTEAAFSHPLPEDFGVRVDIVVTTLRRHCRTTIQPYEFINPATRAIAVYTLIRIADWVCQYMLVFGDSAEHMYPFRNFTGNARVCVERAVITVCDILTGMNDSERELVATDIYHVHIPSVLRELYSHLRLWPDAKLPASLFSHLDRTIRASFQVDLAGLIALIGGTGGNTPNLN